MSQAFHDSCLCGALRHRLSSPPQALSHCHCNQCRKAHGTAFASYGNVPVTDLHIGRGADLLAASSSSPTVLRRFYSRYGSPLFWSKSRGKFADWVSVVLGSLDTLFPATKQKHIQVTSMTCWYRIADDWPRFDRSPPAIRRPVPVFSPAKPGPGVLCRALRRQSLSPMSATTLYTGLSHYYDLMCADIDYQAQSHCVRHLHQSSGNQGRWHLDLACGTGPHMRYFLDFDYRSAGLDISQPTPNLARQRYPEAHSSRQDMAGFQADEPLDPITYFLYPIHYNAGLERLRACLASVHDALADDDVFHFNTVDRGQIDNRLSTHHSVEHQDSRFTFGSGWYYSGEGGRQALRLGIERTTDGTTQTQEDEHPVVALGFTELQHLLQAHSEVQVFKHGYERITPWTGSSGNALFVCVKRWPPGILVQT